MTGGFFFLEGGHSAGLVHWFVSVLTLKKYFLPDEDCISAQSPCMAKASLPLIRTFGLGTTGTLGPAGCKALVSRGRPEL